MFSKALIQKLFCKLGIIAKTLYELYSKENFLCFMTDFQSFRLSKILAISSTV